nr:aminotransferase class I/II-fold pyridoxal phosphate-dependent enzyme [Micromonospora sp. DSM 115978]
VAHRFMTFCAPLPLQLGVAATLRWADEVGYFDQLRADYRARRDLLAGVLAEVGLHPLPGEGSTFLVADTTGWYGDAPPRRAAHQLARQTGVVALPLTTFCARPETADGLLRFAYCKDLTVLAEAGRRLVAGAARRRTAGSPETE